MSMSYIAKVFLFCYSALFPLAKLFKHFISRVFYIVSMYVDGRFAVIFHRGWRPWPGKGHHFLGSSVFQVDKWPISRISVLLNLTFITLLSFVWGSYNRFVTPSIICSGIDKSSSCIISRSFLNIFNELFQTVRFSKWYLHFDTPSCFCLMNSFGSFVRLYEKRPRI